MCQTMKLVTSKSMGLVTKKARVAVVNQTAKEREWERQTELLEMEMTMIIIIMEVVVTMMMVMTTPVIVPAKAKKGSRVVVVVVEMAKWSLTGGALPQS